MYLEDINLSEISHHKNQKSINLYFIVYILFLVEMVERKLELIDKII